MTFKLLTFGAYSVFFEQIKSNYGFYDINIRHTQVKVIVYFEFANKLGMPPKYTVVSRQATGIETNYRIIYLLSFTVRTPVMLVQ